MASQHLEDATIWGLLALCARPHLPLQLRAELRQRAASVSDWDRALRLAGDHGVAPLLFGHLKDHSEALTFAIPDMPAEVMQQARGPQRTLTDYDEFAWGEAADTW